MSYDNIDTLNKFSVSECRNKFAVASDSDQKIMKAYDAVLKGKPEWANRTSYVIAPDAARSSTRYTDLKPDKHVGEHHGGGPEVGGHASEKAHRSLLRPDVRKFRWRGSPQSPPPSRASRGTRVSGRGCPGIYLRLGLDRGAAARAAGPPKTSIPIRT